MAKVETVKPVRKFVPLHRLWPWNCEDETTWMYSDYKAKKVNGVPVITEWIRNPNFKYEV